jgi:hypothetical protein
MQTIRQKLDLTSSTVAASSAGSQLKAPVVLDLAALSKVAGGAPQGSWAIATHVTLAPQGSW